MKNKKYEWFWVYGLGKTSGTKNWVPLYCSRTQQGAQQIISAIRYYFQNPEKADPKGVAELKILSRYRDFRIETDDLSTRTCVNCRSNYLKKIRRDEIKLWKCKNCGNTWSRSHTEAQETPPEAPKKLSKPRNRANGHTHTPLKKKKAQKSIQRTVSRSVKGQKKRPVI